MPSSSVQGPTAWSPRTPWPTPAGTSCSSRRNDEVGGAVRSAEVTAPGYVTDLFSAFYPLAAASPIIRDLHLEDHGLVWRRAPHVLAHALDDGSAALLCSRAEDTAAGLEAEAPGDGDAWLELVRGWDRIRDPLLDALFTPFPPVASATRMVRRLGARRHPRLRPAGRDAGASPGAGAVPRSGCRPAAHRQRHAQRHPARRSGERDVRLAAVHARPGRRFPGAGGRRR